MTPAEADLSKLLDRQQSALERLAALETRVDALDRLTDTRFTAAETALAREREQIPTKGQLSESLQELRSEYASAHGELRAESASNAREESERVLKASVERADSLLEGTTARSDALDQRIQALELSRSEGSGKETGIDRSVLVEERARTRRMQAFAAIGIAIGVIGGILGIISQLR